MGLLIIGVLAAAPLLLAFLGWRRLRPVKGRIAINARVGLIPASLVTTAYVGVFSWELLSSRSSTAGLGFLVLPMTESCVFAGTLLFFGAGALLLRTASTRRWDGLVIPAAVAVAAGAALAIDLTRMLQLSSRAAASDTAPQELQQIADRYREAGRFAVYEGWLGRSGGALTLHRVANSEAASETLLFDLAHENDASTVWRAIQNPKLGAERLREIAKADLPLAHGSLAANPNTPADVLAALAARADPWTRIAIARHPNTPDVLREPLFVGAARSDDRTLRNAAASQPAMPEFELRRLARDEWALVRRTTAANRSTPLDVIEALAGDPDESVRKMADYMLEQRSREAAAR